ncbi:MAG: flagellar basal body P-ring formation chaperone FlgA [Rhodospirillaceae bacterium]
MRRLLLTTIKLVIPFAVLLFTAPADAGREDFSASLKPSVTITGNLVTLGDLFEGDIMRPEKVIAKAPEPGQRFVLGAQWLASLARTYGIDWRPANTYDRTVVYRPGYTIGRSEILDQLRHALMFQGLPNNYGLDLTTALSNITVSTEETRDIGVRETFFDAQTLTFSAVVEIPEGSPTAQYIPVRGTAFPTLAAPVINQNVGRNTLITDSMIEWVDIPTTKVRHDTLMDAQLIIGKAPRTYLRAGQTMRDTDLIQVTLIDIPVPRHDLRNDIEITETHIRWTTFNTADISNNIITDVNRLVGLYPRRFLPSGAPIRISDVHSVIPVEIPVALRDIRRGTLVSEDDFQWYRMNENELGRDVLVDSSDVLGLVARRTIRTGQVFRKRDLRVPVLIERGKIVTIRLSTPMMQLSAKGRALEKGGANDTIRVMNTLSNKTVLATIVDGENVRVETIENAMQ